MLPFPPPGAPVTAEVIRVDGAHVSMRIINSHHFCIAAKITFRPGSTIEPGYLFNGYTWPTLSKGGKLCLVALEPTAG